MFWLLFYVLLQAAGGKDYGDAFTGNEKYYKDFCGR